VTALVAVTFPASVFVTVNERGPVVAVESAVTTTRRQLDVPRALVASIGGFYAFKHGSAEFQHLESEVMRCTGQRIGTFQSVYAGKSFEIGGD